MATRSWNRVELIGNVTRDPELRYTPSGAAVCTFSIATNRTFTSSEGEKHEETDFHRLVAWNKLAELCSQLIKKGNRVFISGRLQNRSWEAQDGQQRTITEIVIEDMILLTSKSESAGSFAGEEVAEITTAGVSSRSVEEMPKNRKPDVESQKEEEPKKTAKNKEVEQASETEDVVGDLDDLPF